MAKEDRRYRKEKVTSDIFNSGHIHFKFLLPPASPDVETDDSDTGVESDDEEEYFPILQRQEPTEHYSDLSITNDTITVETVERVQQGNETATKLRPHCSGATIDTDREDTDREDTDSSQISDAADSAGANPGQLFEIAKEREIKRLETPPPHPDTLDTNDVQTDIAVVRCNDCNSVKLMGMDRTYYDQEKTMNASEETRNENENAQAQQKETKKNNTDLATTSGLNEVPVESNETATEKHSHCADAIIEVDRGESVNIDTINTPVVGRTLTLIEEIELAVKRLGPEPPNPDTLDSNVSDWERRTVMIRYNDYIFDRIMAADLIYKKYDDLQKAKNKKLTTVDDTESDDSVQIVEQSVPIIIINNETDESNEEVCNQNEAQEHTQNSDTQDSTSQSLSTNFSTATLMHDIMSILSPQCDEPEAGNEDVPRAINEKNGQEMDFHSDDNTKECSRDADVLSIADLQQQVLTPEVNKELPNITSFAMLQSVSRKRPTQEIARNLETDTPRKSLSSSDGDNSPRNLTPCGVPKSKIARKSRPRTRDDILQITDEAANNAIFNNPKASTSRARQLEANLASSIAPKRRVPRLHRYGPTDDILLMVEAAIKTMFKKLDAQRGRKANESARLVHLKRRSLRKRTDLKKSKSGPYCHYTSSYPNSSNSSSSETYSD